MKVWRVGALAGVVWLVGVTALEGQATTVLNPSFDPDSWISSSVPFEILLDVPDSAAADPLAILLGDMDVTGLFSVDGMRLAYRGGAIRLPTGESELAVYRVSPGDEWQEVGRVRIRIRTAAGFERAEVAPSIVVNNQGQWAEGHAPDTNSPARQTFQDFNATLGLRTTHERDGWSMRVQANADHRVLAGTLGMELAPRQPGLARVEATIVNGATQPVTGFTQGIVNDAERSRGVGLRVTAASPAQRVRLEAGWARSRFDNPFDASLAQGEDLVPVRESTRGAWYSDLSLDLLRDVEVQPALPLNLGVTWRHERVDPLFRTVTMPSVLADLLQNAIDVNAAVGPVVVQASAGRARDNLDGIPTILYRDAGRHLSRRLRLAQAR